MSAQEGFDEFVRSRGEDLRRLAFLLTGDRRTAERLVQTALVKCLADWREIDKHFDPYSRARELLVGGKQARAKGTSRPAFDMPTAFAGASPDGASPEDATLDDSARDELRTGLAILRGVERSVVVLRVFEGLSEGETADALDTSERVVARHTARALARVRSEAAGPGDGDRVDRVADVRRLARSRLRRRLLATTAVAAVVAAMAFVVIHREKPRDSTAATAATTSSGSASSFVPLHLAPVSAVPTPRAGGLVLQPGGPGNTQLVAYAADTFRVVRTIGALYDHGVHVGPWALDPSDPDRVVFVRVWDLGVVCSAPPCPTPTGSIERQLVWRLFDLRASTGQETALTAPASGQGPHQVVMSPDGWRVALASGASVDILNGPSGGVPPTHLTLASEFVQVLGFLANHGPLVVWETATSFPGVVWATRQWVSTVDSNDPSRQQILYDSIAADCNPTADLWLLPTDQLVLETRCGPRPGPMSDGEARQPDQGIARIYLADSGGTHLIATTTWGPLLRHELQLDSTGTVLLDQLEPKSGGERVVERVSLTGQRARVVEG